MCYVRGCAKSDNPSYDIPLRHHQAPANAAALALPFMLYAVAVVKIASFRVGRESSTTPGVC